MTPIDRDELRRKAEAAAYKTGPCTPVYVPAEDLLELLEETNPSEDLALLRDKLAEANDYIRDLERDACICNNCLP